MPVYKNDCLYCFDTPDSPLGIDVCTVCKIATSPAPQHNFTEMHRCKSGHNVYVNIRRTPKQRDLSEITELKIEAQSESDFYDVHTKLVNFSSHALGEDEERRLIDEVLKEESYEDVQKVEAWGLEIKPCKHLNDLETSKTSEPTFVDTGSCSLCDMTSNLWLCLHCGNVGCGRKHFDGTGGNGHAANHFEQTKHAIAIKLGSISPSKGADVHCYLCDEEIKDPCLAEHLEQWGIDLAKTTKTEKSMIELQLEQNLKWEFAMTSNGEEFEPVAGPGLTGLRNLGNTCYMNAVFQCLFAIPAFKRAFPSNTPENAINTEDPANDLWTQLCKLQDGIWSGKYAVTDPWSQIGYQRGLKLNMLKHIIGRGHPEFSSSRQQDALEYITHVLTSIRKIFQTRDSSDPSKLFEYESIQRIVCNCGAVRYKHGDQENLLLPVPIEVDGDNLRSFTLYDLLDRYTNPEIIDYACSCCKQSQKVSVTNKFYTFPDVLVISVRKFTIENWIPKKVDVPVDAPISLNLDRYYDSGPKLGEDVVDEPEGPTFTPDAQKLEMLESMGFDRQQCEVALEYTQNGPVEAAMEYLLTPPSDLNFEKRKMNYKIDSENVSFIVSMGFSEQQAKVGLLATGEVESAIEWILTNNHLPDNVHMENPKQISGSSSLPANYELFGVICHKGASVSTGHYVAYVRNNGNWVLMNDEKVVKGINIEEMKKFAYIYFYRRVVD